MEKTKAKILFVEDDLSLGMVVRDYLTISAYDVVHCENGVSGRDAFQNQEFDLCLLDVMLPKLDGYGLAEMIRKQNDHIPIIFLTAKTSLDDKITGFKTGADDFITKPFSIRHLELRVKRLIENKQRIIEYFSSSSVIPKELTIPERDRRFLKKITQSIEKNMDNSGFGVEELAKEAGMSTSHFFRRLKQLTGQVPNVYLRNFRLQKAAEMLKANKNLSANEVMFEIGIESPSYFSTSFKKLHGVSPSDFIKNLKD